MFYDLVLNSVNILLSGVSLHVDIYIGQWREVNMVGWLDSPIVVIAAFLLVQRRSFVTKETSRL